MTDKKTAPAFVIDPALTIKWPVTVKLPVDGGERVEFEFTGIFKRLSDAELDKVLGIEEPKKLKALPEIKPDSEKLLAGYPDGAGELIHGELAETPPPAKTMQEVLRDNAEKLPQLLIGWERVKQANGEDAAFSIKTLQAQILGVNGKFISAGLWNAVYEIRNGARLGN